MNSELRGSRLVFGILFALLVSIIDVPGQLQDPRGPVFQLWRNDLVDVQWQLQYHATSVVLDPEDNLFVGGSITLKQPSAQTFSFVARFDKTGTKTWEYWTPPDMPELGAVDGMTSDDAGGIYTAFRIATGGEQLAWIDERGRVGFLQRSTNYGNAGVVHPANSVCLAADGHGGFYLAGLLSSTNYVWNFNLARYGAGGILLWQTNLFRGFFGDAGLDRSVTVLSNSVYCCASSLPGSYLAKVASDGSLQWLGSSERNVPWSSLSVLKDGTACVAGTGNYEVWSGKGERLASHGAVQFCRVSQQSTEGDGFLVSDSGSGILARLDRNGIMQQLGQLPEQPGQLGPPAMISVASNLWLIAANCQENDSPNTNNLSLFLFGEHGELTWRQRLPGFEYARTTTGTGAAVGIPQHWLLTASDGTIRLVVNLNSSSGNPHMGIAVSALSITNLYSGPTLTQFFPVVTNTGPEGTTISLNTAGGNDRYEWHFLGGILYGRTNASVTSEWSGLYCARIMNDDGEMVSPAISVVYTNEGYVNMRQTTDVGPTLTMMPGVAVQFQLETSTNLSDWILDPVVYSWMLSRPTSMIGPQPNASSSRYFRARPLILPQP